MGGLREIGLAISRIILGMLILLEGLIFTDIMIYISFTGSTGSEKIEAAYEDGYAQGYVKTYGAGYQKAYSEAYDKGYNKGYEIGLGSGAREKVATRVELRNPTYKELIEFLARDKTDFNPFIRDEYVCFNFASELNNNAEANGIRAAYVRIRFKEWAHAVVAFQTVDRGLVFIEPQSDQRVTLVMDEPYLWGSAGAVRTTRYDDTIVAIQIIW
ncbi:hypothetical protein ACFLUU_07070 [Chloroflexota bacterium]